MLGRKGERKEDTIVDDTVYAVSFRFEIVSAPGKCTSYICAKKGGGTFRLSITVLEITEPEHTFIEAEVGTAVIKEQIDVNTRPGQAIKKQIENELKRALCPECLRAFYPGI